MCNAGAEFIKYFYGYDFIGKKHEGFNEFLLNKVF